MEEWIIKLFFKINYGLVPDIRGGNYFYFQIVNTVLRLGNETAFLLDLKVLYKQ